VPETGIKSSNDPGRNSPDTGGHPSSITGIITSSPIMVDFRLTALDKKQICTVNGGNSMAAAGLAR
jgi:hypothetical protein